MSDGGETVIQLPGLQDVIRIPALENQALRQERIQRWRANRGKTGLPESMEWLPKAINYLDNAQDILITSLIISKWLAPKLLARFIPGLGWLLTLNDIMNVANFMMGVVTTGPIGKKQFHTAMTIIATGRAGKFTKAADWMQKSSLAGFLWQAPQVTQSVTGYGLALGGIFGTLSESIWGALRSFGGRRVRIQAPPQNDAIMRAAAFLLQSAEAPRLYGLLSPADLDLAMASQYAAMSFLDPVQNQSTIAGRADDFYATQVPQYPLWNPASINACRAEGIDPFAAQTPISSSPDPFQTFGELAQANTARAYHTLADISSAVGDSPSGWQLAAIANNLATAIIDGLVGERDTTQTLLTPEEYVAANGLEKGYFPPPAATGAQLLLWTQRLHALLGTSQRFGALKFTDYRQISNSLWGGYALSTDTRPAGTWHWDQTQYGTAPIGYDRLGLNSATLDVWRKCLTTPIINLPTRQTLTEDPPDEENDPCPELKDTRCKRFRQLCVDYGYIYAGCFWDGTYWHASVRLGNPYAWTNEQMNQFTYFEGYVTNLQLQAYTFLNGTKTYRSIELDGGTD